jgi:hypothetical protein
LRNTCFHVKSLDSASLLGGGDHSKHKKQEEKTNPVAFYPARFSFPASVIIAPPKPSVQTKILLDNMSKSAEDEKSRWDQVMENFDLLFTKMNDIGVVQQQLKTQMDIRGAAMD